MKVTELASRLDGRVYPHVVGPEDKRLALDNGLLIVHGASDDLVEFEGFWTDEASGPGRVYLTRTGLLAPHEDGCECPFCGYEQAKVRAAFIDSHYGREGWFYETAVPHATFKIRDDETEDGLYCLGLVIDVDDLP